MKTFSPPTVSRIAIAARQGDRSSQPSKTVTARRKGEGSLGRFLTTLLRSLAASAV